MKKLTLALAVALGASSLAGCMGHMEATGVVTKANLKIVDNRYGRAGVFILMSPVYAIASVGDLFIFNTIEFWTGKNPISGKRAVVDTPANAILKVNSSLDSSLKTAPIQANTTLDKNIEKTNIKQIDENTMEMEISYVDGSQKVLRGVKKGNSVDFFLDGNLISNVSNQELTDYVAQAQG